MSGESGFYRLRNLMPIDDVMIDNLNKECGDDCKFSLDKVRDFLSNTGQGVDFNFLDGHLKDMVNNC